MVHSNRSVPDIGPNSVDTVAAVHSLPEELWRQIAINLRDYIPCRLGHVIVQRDQLGVCCYYSAAARLRPFTETSRYFHGIVTPLLYAYIYLDEPGGRTRAIVSTLHSNSNLHSFVQTLSIVGLDALPGVQPSIQDLPNRFQQLRSLSLARCNVGASLVQLLTRCERIESIGLSGCHWETELPADRWSTGDPPPFKSLAMHTRGEEPSNCTRLIGARLEDLNIDEACIVELGSRYQDLQHVTRLYLRLENIVHQCTIDLLLSCKKLETLVVQEVYNIGPFKFTIPHDALPSLRYLTAPLKVMRAFRGHPTVSSITVSGLHLANMSPNDLPLDFPSLRTLHMTDLRLTNEIWLSIAQRCPQLEDFSLISWDRETSVSVSLVPAFLPAARSDSCLLPHKQFWIQHHMIDEIGRLSSLRRLCLLQNSRMPWRIFNLPEREHLLAEEEVLSIIKASSCPRVVQVQLSPGYRWVHTIADGWQPSLVAV